MPFNTVYVVSVLSPLSALPERGGAFSILKILLFAAAALLWAYTVGWVQVDMKRLKIPDVKWRYLLFAAGFVSCALWLLIPVFGIGPVLFVAMFAPALVGYAQVRNRRVSPAQSILTKAHFERLTKGSPKKAAAKVEALEAKERTRIKNSNDKTPPWPAEPEERKAHQALQDLLFDAIWRRSSEVRLDLVPQQPVKLIYKVDGLERAREPIEAEVGPLMLKQLKVIAGMDPEEHRRPQAGHFRAAIGAGDVERKVEIIARTSGSTAGQRMILRLISEDMKFRVQSLGLTDAQLAVFERLVAAPKGLVICSAPRGNGLTSTLYAMLRSHDAFMRHIHTLETAKDMDLENISQHLYDGQAAAGMTFGKRLKSILRAEPDICMIADLPDPETAANAADAARQGKKIYLGMQAKDCLSAVRRYMEAVGDNAKAASALVAVANERLVRVLCRECRKGYKPDPKLLQKGNLPMDENRPFFRPPNPSEIPVDKQGNPLHCPVCEGTGYVGRTAVFEILELDGELRGLLAKGTPLASVKVEARKKGMRYLQEVALQKVYDGQTSIQEVLRVTKEGVAPPQAG